MKLVEFLSDGVVPCGAARSLQRRSLCNDIDDKSTLTPLKFHPLITGVCMLILRLTLAIRLTRRFLVDKFHLTWSCVLLALANSKLYI